MDPHNRHADLNMYLAQVQPDGSVKVVDSVMGLKPGDQCKF